LIESNQADVLQRISCCYGRGRAPWATEWPQNSLQ